MPLITIGSVRDPSQSSIWLSSACANRPPSTCMMPRAAERFSSASPFSATRYARRLDVPQSMAIMLATHLVTRDSPLPKYLTNHNRSDSPEFRQQLLECPALLDALPRRLLALRLLACGGED